MATELRNHIALLPPTGSPGLQQSSARFFRLSQLRRLRGCEQVAAVCYRIRNENIEFLLVQTRGGRWTFPKGGTMPGLTHAQAAAVEAFEEAGVHGRIEEAPFARYLRRRRAGARRDEKDFAVNAHLCEVSRLESPQEFDRNPTWCSVEEAKQRFREGRKSVYGDELVRVVGRAVSRIQRLRTIAKITVSGAHPASDPMQKVLFIDRAWSPTDKSKVSGDGVRSHRNISSNGRFERG